VKSDFVWDKRAVVFLTLGLVACSRIAVPTGPARAYISAFDRLLVATKPFSSLFAQPCPSWNRDAARWSPTDQCFFMLPQQRWRGVWVNTPERSSFQPGATRRLAEAASHRIWLRFAAPNKLDFSRQYNRSDRVYLIEFIGRRTRYPGEYGDTGDVRHEILVDRVLSSRLISDTDH
jgi:hypothetical protein